MASEDGSVYNMPWATAVGWTGMVSWVDAARRSACRSRT